MSIPLAAGLIGAAFAVLLLGIGAGFLHGRREARRAHADEAGRMRAELARLNESIRTSEESHARALEAFDRQSEGLFRSLTELLFDWYWRQDEDLRFTYLSSQARDLTGHTGESSYGKQRWELSNMAPVSTTWDEHKAVLAARLPFRDLECRRIGTDGEVRYLSMSGVPIFDAQGRFKGYHGIGRNITERKRIEEELRARQEMLDLAQKAARAVAFEWRIGPGREPPRSSPELEAMLGLAPGAFDGSFENWRRVVFAEDWPAVHTAIQRAHASADEAGAVAVEYRVAYPNGGIRWLQLKGRMSFDDESRPNRLLGFMLDVTERHCAEEEMQRLERQLRQAQRLEAMGTLAGGIAHDFNNILGAILGYGERALRDSPRGSRLRRDLDSILTAGERGRALVDQILTFSRASSNERAAVDVERVVVEALDLLGGKTPAGVRIVPRLRASRAAVFCNPTQVHQVLMNLVTNAFQAMPAGGTVQVLLDAVRVDVATVVTTGTLGAGDYVVLEVADSGVGIAAEIIDRIFDPFFTTKEVGAGTGLGLSLVHGIVTELDGAINVASAPGTGAVFTVYLPRTGEAGPVSEDAAPEAPQGNRERILVVDNEEPLLRLTVDTLQDFGYQPVGFTSSLAALDAFRADPHGFDGVVTDERMPAMTGSALIRELRALRPAVPVVLVSGFIGVAASGARELGADEVLQKPVPAGGLAASLARVLQRARAS